MRKVKIKSSFVGVVRWWWLLVLWWTNYFVSGIG